ncbi:LMBR1 domain-containing protein, putative [Plasmodium vinckei]|uniref:LMBR1 domain-containing protein, putative n=1 Tax=Plasmodium vinckei TaxID=5860 RepID=A0A6V7SIU2_PLAVN|nr:LMBR1 domain-containing protein, putative [Plasmodium vinckei]
MEKGKELDYISDLFDVKHTGESAILFLMGCVVFIGVSFWVSYTSYGLACLPIELLKQKDIEYDKKEIEHRFENLKEKEALIKKKYNTPNEIKEDDKLEIVKINNMKRLLSKYNYKLQEIEKTSESWVSYILGIAFTFRVLTGLIFLTFSSIIYLSLLASITDKYFPLDILVIASLALYIFCCSVYGIVNVGIRIFFIPLYKLKPKKTSPETMLVFCFVMIHIILVLVMSLLTIAPNYVTYGVQKIKIDDEIGYIKCSLKTDKHICKMSVLSVFFNKIFFGIPYFANSYFFSNWFFILMYTLSLLYTIFFKKLSYLDRLKDLDMNSESLDEQMNLLPLEKLT